MTQQEILQKDLDDFDLVRCEGTWAKWYMAQEREPALGSLEAVA